MSDGIPPTVTPTPAQPQPRHDATVLLNKAPVTEAPAASSPASPNDTTRLQGRVVAEQPPVTGQTRIRTDKGDIVVRSERPVPPDTDVIVDLQRQKAALVATVRIAARVADAQAQTTPQAQPPTPAPQQLTPLPAVVPGDRLTALLLSGTLPAPVTPPPAPLSATALQQAVQQLIASSSADKLPLPASILNAFAASPNPEAFLKILPPEHRALLQQYTTPSSVPAPTGTPAPAAMPAPMPADDASTLDTSLLTLLRAMTTARLTQQAVQSSPMPSAATAAPAATLPNLMQALLPLLHNMQTPAGSTGTGVPPPFTGQMAAGAELRIINVQLPGAPQGPPAAPPAMQGSIIGHTSTGMAVIRTPQADFVLNSKVQLPVGSQITFEASPLSFDALAARMTAAGSNPLDVLSSRQWPALSEAMDILAQHAPALAQNIGNAMPTPGPKMVTATLFFMAALKMGMVENWLGTQAMQSLRDHGPRGVADRLAGDFGNIARQSGETLPGEWRGISLPLLHDAQLSQIQMFVRRQREDEDDAGQPTGKTTRFIVNLNLSRLGDMQLDGLMRQTRSTAGTPAKNLDMVIRTADRLPTPLMHDLQDAYARGLSETGLQGSMQFQVQKQGWVKIEAASSPDDAHLA